MFKLLVISICSLMVISCDFTGKLNLHKSVNFKRKSLFGKIKNLYVGQGIYSANFKFTKHKMKVKISGVKYKIQFKVPKDLINQNNFTLPSAVSGQPFDISVQKETTTERAGPFERSESCSTYIEEYHCKEVCSEAHSKERGQNICSKVCGYENVLQHGFQDITYYDVTITQFITARLKEPSSNEVVGNLNGNSISKSNDIVEQSECTIY